MTIYDVPTVVKDAIPLAASPVNIKNGFKATSIFPFNPEIFQECDFMPNYVTDRPDPQLAIQNTTDSAPINPEVENDLNHVNIQNVRPSTPRSTSCFDVMKPRNMSTSPRQDSPQPSTSSQPPQCEILTPEAVRPFPKAGERKQKSSGKRRRFTAILTDTPVKNRLLAEKQAAQQKRIKIIPTTNRKKLVEKYCLKSKRGETNHRNYQSDSEEGDDALCLYCMENYKSSKSGEKWIRCTKCHMWAHQQCAGGRPNIFFECPNCDSTDDMD